MSKYIVRLRDWAAGRGVWVYRGLGVIVSILILISWFIETILQAIGGSVRRFVNEIRWNWDDLKTEFPIMVDAIKRGRPSGVFRD